MGAVNHTDVGAFALGLLDKRDRAAFAAHLAGCRRCRAESRDLTRVRQLLIGIDAFPPTPDAPAPEPTGITSHKHAVSRSTTQRPRDVRRRAVELLGTAAASAALVVAGVAWGGGFTSSDTGPSPGGLSAERRPVSGTVWGAGSAHAAVTLRHMAWGSHITLELAGIQGPLLCALVATDKDGRREVIGYWTVPEQGYGVPSNPDPLVFHGGTSIPLERLAGVEVTVADGPPLVVIPV